MHRDGIDAAQYVISAYEEEQTPTVAWGGMDAAVVALLAWRVLAPPCRCGALLDRRLTVVQLFAREALARMGWVAASSAPSDGPEVPAMLAMYQGVAATTFAHQGYGLGRYGLPASRRPSSSRSSSLAVRHRRVDC
jgi:hypothetical protein